MDFYSIGHYAIHFSGGQIKLLRFQSVSKTSACESMLRSLHACWAKAEVQDLVLHAPPS